MYSTRHIISILVVISIVLILFFSLFLVPRINVTKNTNLPGIEYGSKSMYSALNSISEWNTSLKNNQNEKLALNDVSNILWSGQGENRPGRRVTPSAGATYPLDLYISFIDGLVDAPGLFGKYESSTHSIAIISEITETKELPELQLYSDQVILIIASTRERTSFRYGDRTDQYIDLEIGHVLENLRLQAWSRDISLSTYIIDGKLSLSRLIPDNCKIEVILTLRKSDMNLIPVHKDFFPVLKIQKIQQGLSVEEVIESRVSIRDYVQRKISISEYQSITSLTLNAVSNSYRGNKSLFGESSSIYKPATNTIMITSSKVLSLKAGIYQYSYLTKNFTLLKEGDYLSELTKVSMNQIYIGNAAFNVIIEIYSNLNSIERKIALFEAGIIAQRLYHSAYLSNFGMVVIGAFSDFGVNSLVQIDDYDAMYVIPIGPTETSESSIVLSNLPTNIRLLGGYFGYFSLFIFVLTGLSQNKLIKRKLVIRGLSIHKKIVWVGIGCSCIHISLVYGYYYIRKLWTINVLIEFVLGIFIPPELIPSNLESLGLLFSKVSLFLFLIIFFKEKKT